MNYCRKKASSQKNKGACKMDEKLIKQINFIIEIDRIKFIFRKTKLFDGSRHENDAEHSWHLAMMAMVLAEHANEKIDIGKVIKMVLVHDLPEIDTGDTIIYSKQQGLIGEDEYKAANRIFGILPAEQRDEITGLWKEFEEKKTAESKFAAAIDRLEPVMQNYRTKADAWRKNNISSKQVYSVNEHIGNGSDELWEYAKSLIDECVKEGLIK
jgi:putative hydrolase of HD superfamily